VNYYEHHIGDYAAATAHLSWDEDMAYTRLLRAYYHHERGIPQGQQYRLARATTAAQRKAVDAVLAEFFALDGEAYSQKRADEEITRFQDKQRKAKASANARWAHSERNANASPDPDANAMRTHSEGNAHQTPDTRHQSNTEPTALVVEPPAHRPACPTDALVALYHEHCPTLPRVEVMTATRRKTIATRWAEVVSDPDIRKAADLRGAGLDWFAWYFAHAGKSPFLSGRAKDWKANFDWLINASNFAKVIEGNYHNREAA
jgi:uncharacterized protein YdaU (DUF1376 family)